jgi:hypothetical protein
VKLSRRDFVHAGCAAAMATLLPNPLEARFPRGSEVPQFSQRSVINLGFLYDTSYPFINFMKQATNFGPVSSSYFTASGKLFPSLIDGEGWPNSALADNEIWGSAVGVIIPDPADFTGQWVITWEGDGQIGILDQQDEDIIFTVDSSSGVTVNGNGSYINSASGTSARVVLTMSATDGYKPRFLTVQINRTNHLGGTNLWCRNVQLYQLQDEADLLAGKVFRAAWKQPIVDLNPSAVRFLNWCGGSNWNEYRFENRALPTNASYWLTSNWPASPNYATAASGTNAYTLAAATPTAANPKTTPASFEHGEICTALFTNANVRGGLVGISAMTNANPCQVTTSSPHPFNTGDVVQHWSMNGMGRLNYFPVTVTVVNSTTYTIGVDTSNTTNYVPFVSGGAVAIYNSINVAARGVKPMAWVSGDSPYSIFGNFIEANSYVTLVYDKNASILGDGAGNLIAGAWIPSQRGPFAAVPLEIMTACINELNEESTAPIHMWLPLPYTGLCSMDPDYTTASDYGLNAVDVIVNPSSTQRADGYSELTSGAKLFLEYGNETWNSAGGIVAPPYLARMGVVRWPASADIGPNANYVDMYALRSTIIMRAVQAAGYTSNRVVRVYAGMGVEGFSVSSLNYLRCFGSATPGAQGNYYTTDSLVTGGSFGTPISNHDVFCTATYFDAADSYYTGTGTGSFPDDAAMYNGTAPYVGLANPTQAITNFVAKVKTNTSGQAIDNYLDDSLVGFTATYAAAMRTLGKWFLNYEGGADWHTASGSNIRDIHTVTAGEAELLLAALNSTQWRDAQVGYFNRAALVAGCAMQSIYIYIGATGNQRWSYCMPDAFGGTTTEGQGLLNNPTWVGMSSRNQGLT